MKLQQRDLELERLRGEAVIAKVLARRLWETLVRRRNVNLELAVADLIAELGYEATGLLHPEFEAALTVWETHRIYVEPCRLVHDNQEQLYLAHWPDGTQRNLNRSELLMMGGQDPDQ